MLPFLPSVSIRSFYYEAHLYQSLSAKHLTTLSLTIYLLEFSRSTLLLVRLTDVSLLYNFGANSAMIIINLRTKACKTQHTSCISLPEALFTMSANCRVVPSQPIFCKSSTVDSVTLLGCPPPRQQLGFPMRRYLDLEIPEDFGGEGVYSIIIVVVVIRNCRFPWHVIFQVPFGFGRRFKIGPIFRYGS